MIEKLSPKTMAELKKLEENVLQISDQTFDVLAKWIARENGKGDVIHG